MLIHIHEQDGATPVFIAAALGHVTSIEAMAAAGANVNQATKVRFVRLCCWMQRALGSRVCVESRDVSMISGAGGSAVCFGCTIRVDEDQCHAQSQPG